MITQPFLDQLTPHEVNYIVISSAQSKNSPIRLNVHATYAYHGAPPPAVLLRHPNPPHLSYYNSEREPVNPPAWLGREIEQRLRASFLYGAPQFNVYLFCKGA